MPECAKISEHNLLCMISLLNKSVIRCVSVHSSQNMCLIEIEIRLHKNNSSVRTMNAACDITMCVVKMYNILGLQVCVVKENFNRNFT